MLTAVQLYDADTLFGVLGPVAIAIVGLIGHTIGSRRWRETAEANEALVRARDKEILDQKDEVVACKTEIASLSTAVSEKDSVIDRELERVHDLEEMIQRLGGAKVLDAVLEQSKEAAVRYGEAMVGVTNLFDRLYEKLDGIDERQQQRLEGHEAAAAERNERIIAAFEQLGTLLNGGKR